MNCNQDCEQGRRCDCEEDIKYMNEWLEFSIVILITLVSIAAFAFFIGYLL
jgi:hypothetical protein